MSKSKKQAKAATVSAKKTTEAQAEVATVAKPKLAARKAKAPASTFSLVDVARELKANPKVIRAKFRRHMPNHEGAWTFPSTKRDEILKIAKA
jgi:hypothetical protein